MAQQYVSMRNLRFLLNEVLDVNQITKYPYYAEHNAETFDMTLDVAKQFSDSLLHPYYAEMDYKKPKYEDGTIKVHPKMKEIIKEFGESGWLSATASYEEGGQQMPNVIFTSALFIFQAANTAASSYPFLTAGAANLIKSFGSKELQDTFAKRMLSGEWQGTMALTEPDAGSSLSDITSSAEPTSEGYYKIKGQKIFISAGDHDAVDNVVHLMLAKIKGAPGGVKGISLFVVPKKRIENGKLVDNDVITAGMYSKMGGKGCPIAHLTSGESNNCHGYLVGEPHKGLMYMFQMMNEARLSVGIMANAMSSAAYYASLEYAKERPQGRPVSNKDVARPQSLIIEHADVKRMLLFQKSVMEGCLSFLLQCGLYADLHKAGTPEEKEKYGLLLDLLMPIAKTYPSEMSILSTSQGIQVLGGAGFCDDFPLQQFFRDTRINTIHEGTTGIQAMDLLGRKIPMKYGQALMLFNQEMQDTLSKANEVEALKPYADKFNKTLEKMTLVTMHLLNLAQKDKPEVFLADATLYLEYFGIVCIAWQWLAQGIAIEKALAEGTTETEFYEGKKAAMKYFFSYEVPKTKALHDRLLETDRLTLDLQPEMLN